MKPRIVFFGTPAFAVPTLQALAKAGMTPVAVVTQPPEPVGRHQTLTPSEVAVAARELGLPVQEPRTIKSPEFAEWFRAQRPDVAVLVAYGKILPQLLLSIPRLGFVNVHPSLLPKYRGASPISSAIVAGEQLTGVTIMQLDQEMDHGPILSQVKHPIAPDATAGSLSTELATKGAEQLVATLPDYLAGKLKPKAQNHDAATVTKLLKRTDGDLDWAQTAEQLERAVRAFAPWPGTYSCFEDKRLKIFRAHVGPKSSAKPGTLSVSGTELHVATADGSLIIDELQLAGKKRQTAAEFIRGHQDLTGATVTLCRNLPGRSVA